MDERPCRSGDPEPRVEDHGARFSHLERLDGASVVQAQVKAPRKAGDAVVADGPPRLDAGADGAGSEGIHGQVRLVVHLSFFYAHAATVVHNRATRLRGVSL